MLITHGILSACFLCAFIVTATPIPTPPPLFPRILSNSPSDSLLMRGVDGSASLPPATQVHNNLEAVPHIGAQNVQEVPAAARTAGKIEIRMFKPDVNDENGHQPGSLPFFKALFKKVDLDSPYKYDPSAIHNFASAVLEIAAHLDKVEAAAINNVASFLIKMRYRCKIYVVGWSPVLSSEPTSDQTNAIKAFVRWEEELQEWNKDRYFRSIIMEGDLAEKNFPEAKEEGEENIKSIMAVTGHVPAKFELGYDGPSLRQLCSTLSYQLLKMSVNDTRNLHKELKEVVDHIQNIWRPKLTRTMQEQFDQDYLVLKHIIMLFGTTTSPSTIPPRP